MALQPRLPEAVAEDAPARRGSPALAGADRICEPEFALSARDGEERPDPEPPGPARAGAPRAQEIGGGIHQPLRPGGAAVRPGPAGPPARRPLEGPGADGGDRPP